MTPGFPLAWVNFLLLPSSCTQGALGTQGELTAPGASGGWPLRTHAQSEGHWSLHTALLIPRGAGPSPACWCSVLLPPIHAPALHSPLRPHSLTAQTSAVNSLQTPGLSNRREPLRPPWPRGRTSSAGGSKAKVSPRPSSGLSEEKVVTPSGHHGAFPGLLPHSSNNLIEQESAVTPVL